MRGGGTRVFAFWLGLLAMVVAARASGVHPQDGPHADLRITIEDGGVRFAVGVNLAFMDVTTPVGRESIDAVAPSESAALIEAFERYAREEIVCEIDGEVVEPVIEAARLFDDPDPSMVALFPRTGMRGLIRLVAMLSYVTQTPPESVSITWPTYPDDVLGAEMEGAADGEAPSMVLEALLTAQGAQEPIRFSEAQPTFTWHADGATAASRFARIDAPPRPGEAQQISAITVAAAAFSVFSFVVSAVRSRHGRRHAMRPFFGGIAFAILGLAAVDAYTVSIKGTETPPAAITKLEAEKVFLSLHRNLYRAFDYTSDSDVYDALERSVAGDLHETVYKQIKASLRQAENDDLRGVVTAIAPGRLTISDVEAGTANGKRRPAFKAHFTWTVDGTVYHWGHAHTRTNSYEAEYEVRAVPQAGWRITGQRILSQRRIDTGGASGVSPGPQTIEELLDSLGGDDF